MARYPAQCIRKNEQTRFCSDPQVIFNRLFPLVCLLNAQAAAGSCKGVASWSQLRVESWPFRLLQK